MNFLDKVTYGNLSLRYKEISLRRDKVSEKLMKFGLYDRLFEIPPPANSSTETERELLKLVNILKNLSDVTLEFCKQAEKDHVKLFIEYLNRHGINDINKDDLNIVLNELEPLLIRLKEHYNRPRPYQLANYYGLDIYVPIDAYMALTPAYPSGHSFEGYILGEILSAKYPEHAVGLLKLGKNVGLSRIATGVHYPSDHEFGRYLGAIIIENNLVQL
jgi:acid phosphatase (class A)